jgi:hypothetical protein
VSDWSEDRVIEQVISALQNEAEDAKFIFKKL